METSIRDCARLERVNKTFQLFASNGLNKWDLTIGKNARNFLKICIGMTDRNLPLPQLEKLWKKCRMLKSLKISSSKASSTIKKIQTSLERLSAAFPRSIVELHMKNIDGTSNFVPSLIRIFAGNLKIVALPYCEVEGISTRRSESRKELRSICLVCVVRMLSAKETFTKHF